eukprot:6070971-Prymnesium_polylepis.1
MAARSWLSAELSPHARAIWSGAEHSGAAVRKSALEAPTERHATAIPRNAATVTRSSRRPPLPTMRGGMRCFEVA